MERWPPSASGVFRPNVNFRDDLSRFRVWPRSEKTYNNQAFQEVDFSKVDQRKMKMRFKISRNSIGNACRKRAEYRRTMFKHQLTKEYHRDLPRYFNQALSIATIACVDLRRVQARHTPTKNPSCGYWDRRGFEEYERPELQYWRESHRTRRPVRKFRFQ